MVRIQMMDRVENLLARDWLFRVMIAGGLVLPLLYMARIALKYDNPVDFRYFWVAGRIWAEGGDPYAPDFSAVARTMDPTSILDFHVWLYSPHVWGLTRVLAPFEFREAFWIWTAIYAVLLYAGTAMIALSAFDFSKRWHWGAGLLLLLYTAASTGGSATQTIGQFTAFIYFAAAAFAYAVIRDKTWPMVLALIVITMKASIGLVVVAFVLARPRWWPALVLAGIASLALAAVPVLMSGLPALLDGYLAGLSAYGKFEANSPASMTGLRNLVFYLTGSDMPGLWLASVASLGAIIVGYFVNDPRSAVAILFVLVLFLVPLHLYDLMLVSVLAVAVTRPVFGTVLCLGLLVLFRVGRVTGLIGIEEPTLAFQGSYLASLVLGSFLLASLTLIVGSRARPET